MVRSTFPVLTVCAIDSRTYWMYPATVARRLFPWLSIIIDKAAQVNLSCASSHRMTFRVRVRFAVVVSVFCIVSGFCVVFVAMMFILYIHAIEGGYVHRETISLKTRRLIPIRKNFCKGFFFKKNAKSFARNFTQNFRVWPGFCLYDNPTL